MTRTLVDNAERITRLIGIIYNRAEQTKRGLASFSADLAAAANTLTTSIQPVVEKAQADLEKYFPAGTKMLFRGAAPSSWKKLTDHADYALRLTSGDTGSDAGRFSFSVRFAAGGSTTNDQISWGGECVNAVSRAARWTQSWSIPESKLRLHKERVLASKRQLVG